MSEQDNDLLSRLNALKPSSVTLNRVAEVSSINVKADVPQTREDKLADRLKALRSGYAVSPAHSLGRPTSPTASSTARIRGEVALDRNPDRDWEPGGNDESSLDELLAELGPLSQWSLDPDDPKKIENLFKEARSALPVEDDQGDDGSKAHSPATIQENDAHRDVANSSEDHDKSEDKQDEDAADDYVKQVLAELDFEKKYEENDHHDTPVARDLAGVGTTTDAELPSAPSDLPASLHSNEPPSYEDSELETRFSRLGRSLNLPSTPTTAPSNKASTKSNEQPKSKSKLPTYTDNDIDSWCCICNEDGEVRCLGCDGDIYCQACWHEGHGSRPGQERGHRAVQFVRRGGDVAAVA